MPVEQVGLGCLLIALLLHFGESGPTCLWCPDSALSTDCKYTKQCSDNEACYMDVTISGNGHLNIDMGCRDTRQCGSAPVIGRSIRQSGLLTACSECCTGDLCNSGLCGQPGYQTGGPICHSCKQRLHHNDCDVIKQCGASQECDNIQQSLPAPVGKRQTPDQALYIGNKCVLKCCSSDMCNKDCPDKGTNTTMLPTQAITKPQQSFTSKTTTQQPSTSTPTQVDGVWSVWKSWSVCDKTCGGGYVSRTRECNFPAGAIHGAPCSGTRIEQQHCNTQSCPVDGKWAQWADWSLCSKTCGTGDMTRSRTCTYPAGAPHGTDCSGLSLEQRDCNTQTCHDVATNTPSTVVGSTSGITQFCTYKNKVYSQSQTWQDGCDYLCTCDDASIHNYRCTNLCVAWNLPTVCTLDPAPAGKCCPVPNCPQYVVINYPPGYNTTLDITSPVYI